MAEGSATGTLTLQEGFAAEPVDIAWRDTTEHDLRKRLQPLASQIAAIECRSQQCRLALVGSEQDLARTVDELATEKSLRGVAEQMHLTAPEKQPDGTLKLQVFARFSRYEQPR